MFASNSAMMFFFSVMYLTWYCVLKCSELYLFRHVDLSLDSGLDLICKWQIIPKFQFSLIKTCCMIYAKKLVAWSGPRIKSRDVGSRAVCLALFFYNTKQHCWCSVPVGFCPSSPDSR